MIVVGYDTHEAVLTLKPDCFRVILPTATFTQAFRKQYHMLLLLMVANQKLLKVALS